MTLVKKALVSFAVEQALLDNGGEKMVKLISQKLDLKYGCTLENCFKTPQYINEVLKESYKKKYKKIIHSIEQNLEEFIQAKEIDRFLLKIK